MMLNVEDSVRVSIILVKQLLKSGDQFLINQCLQAVSCTAIRLWLYKSLFGRELGFISAGLFQPRSSSVAQGDLEFAAIPQPQPAKCWDSKCIYRSNLVMGFQLYC